MPASASDDVTDLRARLQTALGARFVLGDTLGQGGFATVFVARDATLGRDVAVKAIDASRLDDDDADAALAEARTVALAEHAHIVPLYEAGRGEGLAYLVMRLFDHGTLADRLRTEGALPPAEVARLGVEIAGALAAAHERGVIHLDIKPDNILLDATGSAAVTDFGIARATGRITGSAGESAGTPHYMSPEQVTGEPVDARSDVYSLGMLLYEAASGRRPIDAESDLAIMARQVNVVPTPLRQLVPTLPTALTDAITRAIAKDPAARWPTAAAMATALRKAGEREALRSPAEVQRRRRRRWYARGALLVGGVAATLATLGYIVVRVFRASTSGPPPAVDAMAPRIPPDVARAVGELAGLSERDTLLYAYVPAGRTAREALLVTQRELIALGNGDVRRWARDLDTDIDLNFTTGSGGVVVVDEDTVYRSLSGRELRVLLLALGRLFVPPADSSGAPRDATPDSAASAGDRPADAR